MKSKGKYIKAKELKSFLNRTMGLMFKKVPETIYFRTRFGLHTFFLKFPIDVIVCDRDYVVKKIKIGLKPNRIFSWNPAYDNVIEAKAGTIKCKKIKIGSKLRIELFIKN